MANENTHDIQQTHFDEFSLEEEGFDIDLSAITQHPMTSYLPTDQQTKTK